MHHLLSVVKESCNQDAVFLKEEQSQIYEKKP